MKYVKVNIVFIAIAFHFLLGCGGSLPSASSAPEAEPVTRLPGALEIAREIRLEHFSFSDGLACSEMVELIVERGPLKAGIVFGADWRPDEFPPSFTDLRHPYVSEPTPVLLLDGTKVMLEECDFPDFSGTLEQLLRELAMQNGLNIVEKNGEIYFAVPGHELDD